MRYLVLVLLLAACKGKTGDTGVAGASAQPCTVVPAPNGSTISCPGYPSQTITNGTNGLDGTLVTAVQFCSGVTPSYPTTFPEYALCISGNLYAVYSANDGFLTLIPPGTYDSNAVGSACTFTVLPDCEIQ